jgi:hypothetical protein
MSTRLKEVAEKKSEILSKILKVDPKSLKTLQTLQNRQTHMTSVSSSSSEMNTRIIANMQNRINVPLFNLTIADYEAMCGNKTITKMMSKVLECDEKRLKKFCKYINVFKNNINLSPKSIKNKMNSKMTLNKLPNDLKTQIVEQYRSLFSTTYVLKDWISSDWRLIYKINWTTLSRNPNAIDMLKENPKKIDWVWLSANPNAIELLKTKSENIYWPHLSMNPSAIELLKAKRGKIDWNYLSKNPNPEAIEMLKKNPKKIDWEYLSENTSSKVIELIGEKIKLENNLNKDQLDDLPDSKKISWKVLSANPIAIELLKRNRSKIDWKELSANPNAIELLQANQEKINWPRLSSNPKAIELLKRNKGKINWPILSANPNAIELLKINPKKIDWEYASMNPAIFEVNKL